VHYLVKLNELSSTKQFCVSTIVDTWMNLRFIHNWRSSLHCYCEAWAQSAHPSDPCPQPLVAAKGKGGLLAKRFLR